jgi:hypothetical protein
MRASWRVDNTDEVGQADKYAMSIAKSSIPAEAVTGDSCKKTDTQTNMAVHEGSYVKAC